LVIGLAANQIRSKIPANSPKLRETFFCCPRIALMTSDHAEDKHAGGLILAFAA